ncbi:MAG: hypothetical protein FJW20_11475 [Acidimicrobiia bacterium]|nr:hypothetical protein [Acidimicrobiia bacterium]
MERLTQKTSTILISVGDDTQVYRSVSDVPADLRRKLLESTSGANSGTVLIADEAGRQQIIKSLQGEQGDLQSRLMGTLRKRGSYREVSGQRWRQVAELAVLGGIGLCLWLLASWR